MAIIKKKEMREMSDFELAGKLAEVKRELNSERGKIVAGGRATNPGRMRELRKTIARINTLLHERKLGIRIKEKPKEGEEKAEAPSYGKEVGKIA